MTTNILRIDASARHAGSATRALGDAIVDRLAANRPVVVTTRDLADPLPQITGDWVGANFTAAGERSAEQREVLSLSDTLVAELQAADTVVFGLPVYNFGVPASLKAWIDLVARVGLTFRYGENGPVGLLQGKRAIIAFASGGTQPGSEIDFASPYLRHVLGFVGITDVTLIDSEAALETLATELPLAA